MKELYALYNPRSNRFVIADRSYEMLKSIQFVLTHKILLYCVRVSDIENYREGILDRGRLINIGLADSNRINIAVDIHPKSEPYIRLIPNTDPIDSYHTHLVDVVSCFHQFIKVFNKEYGYFQDTMRTKSRNQKMHLEQLAEFSKLVMPDDQALLDLIKWETDYKFSIMKYLRSYKGEVFQMLYNNIDIEQSVDDIRQQIGVEFNKIPIKCHLQRYIHPKISEWLNVN